MNEIWKDIEGFEKYQVSNLGRVKSKNRKSKTGTGFRNVKEKILKQSTNSTGGYCLVGMYDEFAKLRTKRVHRLVAEAFVPNPEDKPQVNHKDGNRTNNCISNLEWVTSSENISHAYNKLGKKSSWVGGSHPFAKLNEEKVKNLILDFEEGIMSRKQLSKYYGIDYSTVCYILRGDTWKHIMIKDLKKC